MKRIEHVQLFFQEGSSNKVYEVDLCEVGDDQFVVNFRYGRRDSPLRDGTKTKSPVDRAKADSVFQKLVESKRKKGYREAGESAAGAEKSRSEDAAGSGAAIEALLAHLQKDKPAEGEPSLERVIWRLGERRAEQAVPRLIELAGSKGADKSKPVDRRYCIAWALGRIGDGRAIQVLEELSEDSKPEVRRIALHALFLCLQPEARQSWVEGGLGRLPEAIRQAVAADDIEGTFAALVDHLKEAKIKAWSVVELLYLLDSRIAARAAVIRWLHQAPLSPPAFQRLRHIYKAAELRLDAEVLALVAHRFDTERSVHNNEGWYGYSYVDGGYVNLESELKKSDSKVAYPSRTRNYLRRRVARLLRKEGELGHADFVRLATALLLGYQDSDAAPEPYQREWWDWETDQSRRIHYDRFNHLHLLNFVLYRHSPRYRQVMPRLGWCCQTNYKPGGPAPLVREEAFPKLWDKQPESLLTLITESSCAPVHEMAARALQQHLAVVDAVEIEVLIGWLGQPYEPTVSLALESARRRWQPENPDFDLVLALLAADLDAARGQALAWIQDEPRVFLSELSFLLRVITHAKPEVRAAARDLLENHTLPPTVDQDLLVARCLAELLTLGPATEGVAQRVRETGEILRLNVGPSLRRLGFDVLRDLLSHEVEALRILGGKLVLDHQAPAEEMPADLLTLLLEDESDEVRGLGVQLIARLPIARLAEQEDMILAYCLAPAAPVRVGARSLLTRVAGEDSNLANALAAALAVRLLRAERHEGLHGDVLAMVGEDLSACLPSISADLAWRLLRSSRSAAQSLGSLRFATLPADAYSVRKLALLAAHDMHDVRQKAWDHLQSDLPRTLQKLDDVFVALDNDWDDGRERGFDFFRQQVPAESWTPERLVALCDSVREEVQRFGQELLQEHFQSDNGAEYLLKLSQHPAASMQLFATHYLERFAAGRPDRLRRLDGYFKTVLSQVNRGRVAKDRVLAFLLQEGLASAEAAALVMPILQRVCLTVARGDRSEVIVAMRDLGQAHPELATPLVIRGPEVRSPEVSGPSSGPQIGAGGSL